MNRATISCHGRCGSARARVGRWERGGTAVNTCAIVISSRNVQCGMFEEGNGDFGEADEEHEVDECGGDDALKMRMGGC